MLERNVEQGQLVLAAPLSDVFLFAVRALLLRVLKNLAQVVGLACFGEEFRKYLDHGVGKVLTDCPGGDRVYHRYRVGQSALATVDLVGLVRLLLVIFFGRVLEARACWLFEARNAHNGRNRFLLCTGGWGRHQFDFVVEHVNLCESELARDLTAHYEEQRREQQGHGLFITIDFPIVVAHPVFEEVIAEVNIRFFRHFGELVVTLVMDCHLEISQHLGKCRRRHDREGFHSRIPKIRHQKWQEKLFDHQLTSIDGFLACLVTWLRLSALVELRKIVPIDLKDRADDVVQLLEVTTVGRQRFLVLVVGVQIHKLVVGARRLQVPLEDNIVKNLFFKRCFNLLFLPDLALVSAVFLALLLLELCFHLSVLLILDRTGVAEQRLVVKLLIPTDA